MINTKVCAVGCELTLVSVRYRNTFCCSYDRQRGINLNSNHEDGTSPAPPVPLIQGRKKDDCPHGAKNRSNNLGAASSSSGATGSVEVQGGGALAPCFDGGMSDNGSVAKILARSLGNAAAAVRRNRPGGGGEAEGRRSTSKRVGEGVGADSGGEGSRHHPDSSAVRPRWRSWNELPPEALLTAEEIRSASTEKQEDDRRRQKPPPDVVAEVVPPLQTRRRLKNGTGNSGYRDGKKGPPENSAHGWSGASTAAAKGTPNNEERSRGSKEGGPLSTASPAPSRRSSAGGIPLVPRVAMLAAAAAAASTAEKNHAGAIRKGKDFDPDQLECVRRHEASVAEKERRVRSLRTEEEKRTHFRARPLPGFLECGGGPADPAGRGASGGGGGIGQQSNHDQGTTVISATGDAGTTPELLAALEQVSRSTNDQRRCQERPETTGS